ncbi:MAG: hypothetical protein Q9182_006602 [Xanthomendoza sp. 2 TL-2023]
MTQRYTRAELQYLRGSPLVAKPASLPPTEEWMGPLPDPNQKKVPNRGKGAFADAALFTNPLHSAPDDIVLGPPKTPFPSAAGARSQNRTFDSPSRLSFGGQGDETARGDRQNFRDKFTKQTSRNDADLEASQEPRSGTQQHRRATNENDPWSARQTRGSGQDEGEKGSRRHGCREQDRDRDNAHESRPPRGFEAHRRDAPNSGSNDTRRNGQGRGRHEPSWYRDDKDVDISEVRRDTTKARDWREKNRGNVREAEAEWTKAPKKETDPEWMDEPDVSEKNQTHTQEDFERWKERMKAGNGPTHEVAPPTSDQRPKSERVVSGIASPAAKAKVGTPLVVDPSIDGFFGQWNGLSKKETSTDNGAPPLKAETIKPKATKSSKFTGFFGSKALPAEQEAEAPAIPPLEAPADSSSEDKEGFQRILKLLDQQQTNTSKDPTIRVQSLRNPPTSPIAPTPRQQQRSSSNVQDLLVPRSKNGGPLPPNKDSEFLLNLMRQSRSQANPADSRLAGIVSPELLPFNNILVSPQHTPTSGLPPGLSNAMGRQDAQSHDKLNPTTTHDRKIPPPGLFEPQRPGPQDSVRLGKDGPDYGPSYISQHAPQPQLLRQGMMPPPGFQAPLRNPTQFPPGLLSGIPSGGQDRGVPYPMRMGAGNTLPSMPPPGFTNAPPPGFAPMPMNQENAARMYFGGLPRPAPGEGYGEMGDFGLNGQFRRQD